MNKRLNLLVLLVTLLLSGCETIDNKTPPIVSGEKNAALIGQQEKQIEELKRQKETLQQKYHSEKVESSKAAASVSATLESSKYVEPPLVREAIVEESKVALSRLPEPDPAEKVRALERMMLIITGQRDEALRKYAEVSKEVEAAKKKISEKDDALSTLKKNIEERDVLISGLKTEAAVELEKAKADRLAEIKRIKEEYESKERSMWILWVRIASLVLIVGGAIMLAVFKMLPEGAGLVAAGTTVGVVSIFVTWLTAQWWFPWMMGFLLIGVFVAFATSIYKLYKRKVLHEKLTAAMQDLKDESIVLKNDTWEKTAEHIKYRLGDKNSGLGKLQTRIVKNLGLDE